MDMKLIYGPTVYLMGKQQTVEHEVDRFLRDIGVSWSSDTEIASQELVEIYGRNCYQSYATPRPGGNSKYIEHLLESKHGSCIEAAVWNMMITGVSRSLTHELIRHRHFSVAQLSQRYCREDEAEYVVPPDLQDEVREAELAFVKQNGKIVFGGGSHQFRVLLTDSARAGLDWMSSVHESHLNYISFVEHLTKKAAGKGLSGTDGRKFARQAARSVLPNATETKIAITGNARIFRHFIEMRASTAADPEIRVLACKVWEVLSNEAPNLFGDYQKVSIPGGGYSLTTPYQKV